jgi:hypothetical protein
MCPQPLRLDLSQPSFARPTADFVVSVISLANSVSEHSGSASEVVSKVTDLAELRSRVAALMNGLAVSANEPDRRLNDTCHSKGRHGLDDVKETTCKPVALDCMISLRFARKTRVQESPSDNDERPSLAGGNL